MSILINWTNPAQPADGIQIYRSTAPFDSSNLPAVLATIPATDTEYEDTTNLLNVVYYYRVGRVIGSDLVLSKQLALSERTNLGLGPTALIRGDYDTGYFGTVTSDQLFTTASLSTELNFSVGTVIIASPKWHKFIHEGKIKFIPESAIRFGNFSWSSLYNNGLVYGSDDHGAYGSLTPVLQNRRVSKDGYTYKVRCVKVHGKSSQILARQNQDKTSTPDSEYSELVTRLMSDSSFSGANRWNDGGKLINSNFATLSCGRIPLMAGLYGGSLAYFMNSSGLGQVNYTGVNSSHVWLPVLELED